MKLRIRGLGSRVRQKLAKQSQKRNVDRRLQADPGLSAWPTDQSPVLFFSPEAGFRASSIIQSVLARTLKESGHPVVMARCVRLFERCPVMDLHALPYTAPAKAKERVCLDCIATSFEMFDSYGLEALDLKSFLTPEVEAKYRRVCESLPDDLASFEYESIPLGKLCLFDIVLHTKLSEFDRISDDIRAGWKAYIKSSLLSFFLTESICKRIPLTHIVHVNNYSLLLGARFAARKFGIPAYSALLAPHKGNDYSRYVILPEFIWESLFRQGRAWKEWRDLSLSPEQINEVADDTLVRFSAQSAHTYSPPKQVVAGDIRLKLGLSTTKKLVVAYTSSLDEILAIGVLKESIGIEGIPKREPFRDQIDWLEQLIKFANHREDLQLVVRIHPREGINRRDAVTSQHLAKLKQAFGGEIPNCRFVWPAEPISSYDLAEAADVVLTSWSTIGDELARLGAPVLTSTSGVSAFPHDDFLEFGETPQLYFEKLLELLDRPTNIETIARAFRWYNLFHLGTSLKMNDLIPRHDSVELPQFRMPREAEAIQRIIIGGEHPLDLNYERLRRAQRPDNKREELLALQAQLRRIIHFFHTGENSSQPCRLFLLSSADANGNGQEHVLPSRARTISLVGNQTRYSADGKIYSRYSPMCARLASVCAESLDQLDEAELQTVSALG
jgi:hypothetical protein